MQPLVADPQPVEVPSNDTGPEDDGKSESHRGTDNNRGSGRRERSEARGNGDANRTAKKEENAEVASFDGELPQFLQKPDGDAEVAEKPKRARRSPSRAKTAKAAEKEASDATVETASADAGDDTASDAEVAAG